MSTSTSLLQSRPRRLQHRRRQPAVVPSPAGLRELPLLAQHPARSSAVQMTAALARAPNDGAAVAALQGSGPGLAASQDQLAVRTRARIGRQRKQQQQGPGCAANSGVRQLLWRWVRSKGSVLLQRWLHGRMPASGSACWCRRRRGRLRSRTRASLELKGKIAAGALPWQLADQFPASRL